MVYLDFLHQNFAIDAKYVYLNIKTDTPYKEWIDNNIKIYCLRNEIDYMFTKNIFIISLDFAKFLCRQDNTLDTYKCLLELEDLQLTYQENYLHELRFKQ